MKSILNTILALVTLAVAAPQEPPPPPPPPPPPAPPPPPPPAPIDPAKTTHLYICTDAKFEGNCTNLEVTLGECYGVGDLWNDNISSLGPDDGIFCSAFPEPDCRSIALPFTYPGIRDLARYEFTDVISSYRCNALGGIDKVKKKGH